MMFLQTHSLSSPIYDNVRFQTINEPELTFPFRRVSAICVLGEKLAALFPITARYADGVDAHKA
jgi:hypothetical protein